MQVKTIIMEIVIVSFELKIALFMILLCLSVVLSRVHCKLKP